MLIVCPSCASEYMIDPGRLGAEGRTVRCASCKDTWFVTPEPEEPEVSAGDRGPSLGTDEDASESWDEAAFSAWAATDGVETAATTPGSLARLRGGQYLNGFARRARQFAAGPLLILIGIIVVGSVIWGRAYVVRSFPATAALYASFGLPVNLRGIEFRGIRSELVTAGADTFLVVEGEIANISGRDAIVPPIEIGVRGAEGQMLYTWTNAPPREMLTISDTAHFRARLAAPPAEAREVLVRFAAGQDAPALVSQMRY